MLTYHYNYIYIYKYLSISLVNWILGTLIVFVNSLALILTVNIIYMGLYEIWWSIKTALHLFISVHANTEETKNVPLFMLLLCH